MLLTCDCPVPDAATLQSKFSSINAVYWTLAIEVQFYIVVAIGILTRRFNIAMSSVFVASIAWFLFDKSHVTGLFFPFWPMFFGGLLLHRAFAIGLAPSSFKSLSCQRMTRFITVILVVALIVILAAGTKIGDLEFAAIFVLILYLSESWESHFIFLHDANRSGPGKIVASLVMLASAMSYSLYLLHGRLQHLSMQIIRQFLGVDSVCFDVAVMLFTCVLCYCFYLCCEKPFVKNRVSNPSAAQ